MKKIGKIKVSATDADTNKIKKSVIVIYIKNEKALNEYVSALRKKYGKGKIPLEELMKFKFDYLTKQKG